MRELVVEGCFCGMPEKAVRKAFPDISSFEFATRIANRLKSWNFFWRLVTGSAMSLPKLSFSPYAIRMKRETPTDRSAVMAAVKSENTRPEMTLRKALTALGLRYRLHRRDLPGRPDIVFARHQVAIFVDGDFWHGRNWSDRRSDGRFRASRGFWNDKFRRNVARDKRVNRELRRMGWAVLRCWASDIEAREDVVVAKILRKLRERAA